MEVYEKPTTILTSLLGFDTFRELLVFEVLKTKERQAIDARLKDHEKQLGLFDVHLRTVTYDKAKALASGWDIYALEAEWKVSSQ
jgi:hypothetical protein